MILVGVEESCPFCKEDVELDCGDNYQEVQYVCECGAIMNFSATLKFQMDWAVPKKE